MPDFIIVYHGGNKPETKRLVPRKWRNGRPGSTTSAMPASIQAPPLGQSRIVSAVGFSDDGGSNAMLKFSVVMAADIDAALELAKRCPFLDFGGTLEVAEMLEMP
jgi:hypothetical protein